MTTDAVTPEAKTLKCPLHDLTDCSPLLNGCDLLLALRYIAETDAPLVRDAIEGVADTYTEEGVAIWWREWLTQDAAGRLVRLDDACGYGGMVAT